MKEFIHEILQKLGFNGLTPIQLKTLNNPINWCYRFNNSTQVRDWPIPDGYVIQTCNRTSFNSALHTWDHWRDDATGDGYQTIEAHNDGYVRFTSTLDGGTPHVQYFVGGTGWIVFGVDAPTGKWRNRLATLNISDKPNIVPPTLNYAFTRYRRELINHKMAVNQNHVYNTDLEVIISEHYDGKTIASSQKMERSFLGLGIGLIRWEVWGKNELPKVDLSERYFSCAYSVTPDIGWNLLDSRIYTNYR